ncbi:MAG: nitroreductase family protein [Thermoplasmata archaeon]|nr:nitroreductase family protein [Thermoplasmata archaeon]
MDLMDAIKGRRSIRRYKATLVPDALLREVLCAARYAPSANNAQPWTILVVRDEDTKLELVAAANGQKFIAQAPVVLVILGFRMRHSRRSVDT